MNDSTEWGISSLNEAICSVQRIAVMQVSVVMMCVSRRSYEETRKHFLVPPLGLFHQILFRIQLKMLTRKVSEDEISQHNS